MSDFPIGEFKFECAHCGSTSVRESDDTAEGRVIVCNGCGKTLCTVAELNAEIVRQGRAAMPGIANDLGAALKGIKGFKSR